MDPDPTHSRTLISGASSPIAQQFIQLLPPSIAENLVTVGRSSGNTVRVDLADLEAIDRLEPIIQECDRILLAHATIGSQRFSERTESDIIYSVKVNLLSIVRIVEIALRTNQHARIVVVGSESGVKGSYDITYGLSKAALHWYVQERRLTSPSQQLVCVAPSLIEDAGMTTRRNDKENVKASIEGNPQKRGLTSMEVAQTIYHLLFVDRGYTSGTVLHMNGGKFARLD